MIASSMLVNSVYAQGGDSDIEYEDEYQTTDFKDVQQQDLKTFFTNYYLSLEDYYAGYSDAVLNYPYEDNALYQLIVDNRESGYFEGYQILNWEIVEETYLNNGMDVNLIIEREVTTPNYPGSTNTFERVNYDLHLQSSGEWKIERYFIISNDDATIGDIIDFFDLYYANQKEYYAGGSDTVLNQIVSGTDLYNLVANNGHSGGFYNYEITDWRLIDVQYERDTNDAVVLMERDFVNPSSQSRHAGLETVTYSVTGLQGNLQLTEYEILDYQQNELQLLTNYFESYFEAQRAFYAGESNDVLNFPEEGNDLYNLLVNNSNSGYFTNYQVMDWKIVDIDYQNTEHDVRVLVDRLVDNPAQNLQDNEIVMYELQFLGNGEYKLMFYERQSVTPEGSNSSNVENPLGGNTYNLIIGSYNPYFSNIIFNSDGTLTLPEFDGEITGYYEVTQDSLIITLVEHEVDLHIFEFSYDFMTENIVSGTLRDFRWEPLYGSDFFPSTYDLIGYPFTLEIVY